MKLSKKQVFILTLILILLVAVFGIFYYLGTRHQSPKTQSTASSNTKIAPAVTLEATPSATPEVTMEATSTPTPTVGIIKIKSPIHILPISTNTPTPTPTMGFIKTPIKYYPITTP
jgi:hypothetical protein